MKNSISSLSLSHTPVPELIHPNETYIYLFDLDKTLLSIDSDHSWGEFLCQMNILNAYSHRQKNDAFYHAYLAGELNIYDHLEYQLGILTQHPIEKLQLLHECFMEEIIIPHILPQGWKLIQDIKKLQSQHPNQVVISLVTATNDFITKPIADYFGIDLVATKTEKIFSQNEPHKIIGYTGKPDGIPCFQEGKINNTNDYLTQKSLPTLEEMTRDTNHQWHTWFYSDSRNDQSLLEMVKNPVATNPDAFLRAYATKNNWQIIDWI
jgi:phosphoserine phosphatase